MLKKLPFVRLGSRPPRAVRTETAKQINAPAIPASVADVLKINAEGEPTLPDGRTFAQMNADIVERALAVVATVPEGAWAARLIEAETGRQTALDGWNDTLALMDEETARRNQSWHGLIDLHRGHLRQAAGGVRAAQDALNEGDIEQARAELAGVTDLLHTIADIHSEQLPGVWQQLDTEPDSNPDETAGDKN